MVYSHYLPSSSFCPNESIWFIVREQLMPYHDHYHAKRRFEISLVAWKCRCLVSNKSIITMSNGRQNCHISRLDRRRAHWMPSLPIVASQCGDIQPAIIDFIPLWSDVFNGECRIVILRPLIAFVREYPIEASVESEGSPTSAVNQQRNIDYIYLAHGMKGGDIIMPTIFSPSWCYVNKTPLYVDEMLMFLEAFMAWVLNEGNGWWRALIYAWKRMAIFINKSDSHHNIKWQMPLRRR